MAAFILCAGAMLAAALAWILVPLLRRRRSDAPDDAAARRLRALDEALAAGVIDAAEHAAKRAALPATPANPPRSRAPLVVAMLVALLMPAAAILLYRLVGAPQALDPAQRVAAQPAAPTAMDMDRAIAGLAARLEQQPDDAQGWALLGRAYQATGRTRESLDALRRAHDLAPDDSSVAVEYAQAIAVVAGDHRIDGEARTLLDGVLAKEPDHQRALWLVGISEYQAGRYDAAIARWNALLPLLDAGSDVAASVRRQIADAEAKRDGRETAATNVDGVAGAEGTGAASTASQARPGSVGPGDASAASPQLVVQVSLDPKLQAQLDPKATLFVFARAASGPPMPLAIRRLEASQLPLTVTLDDSVGMLPDLRLSMFPQVVVGARVSKSGHAMPQSGDLQALSMPIDVHRREPLPLTIDSVVP